MTLPSPELPSVFALRTTSAALLAFAAAWSVGIHHPWWAAMTVWLVGQPTRGLLLERSLARLIGTICGALAGALILDLLAEHRLGALVAVAIWLALCAGLGSIFRHFRNYGFVLAGYTASIVVLFGLGEGVFDADLARDRVLCTVIGILCSALLSFGALPGFGKALARRPDEVVDRCLAHVAALLCAGAVPEPSATLLRDIAALDRSVDDYAAGSLRRRQEARCTRRISGLLLELIALSATPSATPRGGRSCGSPWPQKINAPLEARLSSLIEAAKDSDQQALADTLDELRRLLRAEEPSPLPLRFDIDPSSVWRAAARPVLALAIATIIWWASGWASGAMMVMTAALFTCLLSSHDQGNHAVIQVLLGTLAGASAGVLTRLLVLPHADGVTSIVLCIAPFLLAGAWLMQRPATSKMAIDLTMSFLLTSQPSSPPADAARSLNEAAAMVVGVLVAAATFWAVLPATPAVRRHLLAQRIGQLTLQLSESRGGASAKALRQSLRSTLARLLDFTQPQSAIFLAAQECLAAACRMPTTTRAFQNSSISSPNASARAAATRQAATTLSALLAKPRRDETP
jgi:uncharacterized membrane protein YccC